MHGLCPTIVFLRNTFCVIWVVGSNEVDEGASSTISMYFGAARNSWTPVSAMPAVTYATTWVSLELGSALMT